MKRALATLVVLLSVLVAHADDDPFAPARKYVKSSQLEMYFYHDQYIGNGDGFLAPIIRTSDGGFLIVGTRSDNPPGKYQIGKSRPVVVKLDASGKKIWEKAYKKKGFLDYEGASAIETADGAYVVYILSYVHPARMSVARLLKIDDRGKILWHRQLRGNGKINTPFPQTVQMTERGTFLMKGHIYLTRGSETANGWEGEIGKDGKLLRDEVGDENPYD